MRARGRIPPISAFLVAALPFLALAGAARAQVDGKIVGTVTDAETGEPLVGVTVTVTGTTLGNVTGEDGVYFLNRVPAGVQRVAVSLLGYADQERRLRVLAGHTSTVDFALTSTPVEAEGVVAVIQREPLLIRDKTATRSHFTREEAVELPVETVDDLIALSAGIYQGQGGFIIRGGRGTESATYVDGVLTSDFTTQRDLTEIGTFAVEQVDVVTGGFSAEYGYAQSGLINIVTRSGGTEFHGNVRLTTDGRLGTTGLDYESRRALETQSCCGYNSLQAAIGGPVVPNRLTLFGSLELTGAADLSPRSGGFNPLLGGVNSSGSTESILPGNRGDRTRLQFKTAAYLPSLGDIEGTLLYSRDQAESFNPLFGVDQHLAQASRTDAADAILSWTRPLFQTSERDMTVRLRAHAHHSESHRGVPQTPETAAILRNNLGAACGAECDVNEDTFDKGFLNYRFSGIDFFFEDSLPGSVLNLRVPFRSAAPDPVFGTADIFRDTGFSPYFSHAEENRRTLRFDLDTQLDRYNRTKIGTEWTWIDLDRREGALHNEERADLYHVNPRVGAAYVQHRWDDGDLVVDVGLRWDYWNPNTTFPALPGAVPCDLAAFRFRCTPGAETTPGKSIHALAPRLGIAHPLTDKAQLRLSFGRFHQLPELEHYFRSYRVDSGQFRGVLFGNPQLDYIETTGIEFGLTWLLARETAVDLVGYKRDRKGAIRAEWFQPGVFHPDLPEMFIFVNGDHGTVKGLDITLTRRMLTYFTANVTWSLQWAQGTTSSPLEWVEGFGALHDPLNPGRLLLPPNALSPESYDRLHNVDARLLFQVPRDFRPATMLGDALSNLRAAFVLTAQSGTPYTPTDPDTRYPAGPPNSARNPWTYNGNLRLVKGIPVGSDGASVDLFLLVNNVFVRSNVLGLHPTTGLVGLGGLEGVQAANPQVRRDFIQPGALASFPLAVSDILPQYQAAMSRQDLDGDGVITLMEAQTSLFRAIVGSGSDTPSFYGSPMTMRFGVEYRF